MKKVIMLLTVVTLTACTTPAYTLKDRKTGQVAQCGGNVSSSLAGGVIGYHIQKSNDAKCVKQLESQGFKIETVSP